MFDFKKIDKSWTLFLDRDGVFNPEKEDDYILNPGEFHFYDNVLGSVKTLNDIFGVIVMATNQKGIGKGVMTIDDFNSITNFMLTEIVKHGGRIDKVYFSADLENDAVNRKPNPGMAFRAKKDFPQIDFNKSIMVGNKITDMQFGRNAGMSTVFLATTNPETPFPHPLIDARFNDLPSFAEALTQ